MHETDKPKVNLIYNHNFKKSLILLCRKMAELRASKSKLQEKTKGARLKNYCLEKAYSGPTYSNQFRQVLSKIINPMQPPAKRIY